MAAATIAAISAFRSTNGSIHVPDDATAVSPGTGALPRGHVEAFGWMLLSPPVEELFAGLVPATIAAFQVEPTQFTDAERAA